MKRTNNFQGWCAVDKDEANGDRRQKKKSVGFCNEDDNREEPGSSVGGSDEWKLMISRKKDESEEIKIQVIVVFCSKRRTEWLCWVAWSNGGLLSAHFLFVSCFEIFSCLWPELPPIKSQHVSITCTPQILQPIIMLTI